MKKRIADVQVAVLNKKNREENYLNVSQSASSIFNLESINFNNIGREMYSQIDLDQRKN